MGRGTLALHDVSPYIYTGMNSKEFKDYTFQGFPVGGLKLLSRYIATNIGEGIDFAFFFDEGRSFRKELLPEYKKGRSGSVHIHSQVEIAKEMLLRCNISCYSSEGLEADDLIYSAVEQNRPKYDKITVHTADYDLAHNVDEKVKFMAVNSNVNNVDHMNFSYAVVKGEIVPLNTISAHKVFFGCNSDKVPAFHSDARISNQELYSGFIQLLEKYSKDGYINIELARNKRTLQLYAKSHPGLTEHDKETLLHRIEVIYPRLYDSFDYEASNRMTMGPLGNLEFEKLLTVCGEIDTLRRLGKREYAYISDDEKEYFRRKARELSTGEFAADRGLNLAEPTIQSELMDVRDFL